MTLDLSSLQKAVGSLGRAVKVASLMIKGNVNTDHEEVIRSGVIQNFEFTKVILSQREIIFKNS